VPTISASQAPATGREARRITSLPSITQADAQLVILDLGQVQFIGRTAARVAQMADARARRTGGRLVVVAAPAHAPRLFALARLHRRLEIVEQFPRTSVQEVPV
jgi:anti-anti-sigma factor